MMLNEQLVALVMDVLDDGKAKNIIDIDVRGKTSMTDFMIVASGSSARHVKALAHGLLEKVKEQGIKPIGHEGMENGEWALIDLNEVIVHIMQGETRQFYDLERLWQGAEQTRAPDGCTFASLP